MEEDTWCQQQPSAQTEPTSGVAAADPQHAEHARAAEGGQGGTDERAALTQFQGGWRG